MLTKVLNRRIVFLGNIRKIIFYRSSYLGVTKFHLAKFYDDLNSVDNIESAYVPKTNINETNNLKNKFIPNNELSSTLELLINKNEIALVEQILFENKLSSIKVGVLTYLMNHYLDVGETKKAMDLFQNMKQNGKMKHLRLYGKLITALCLAKEVDAAYILFEEYKTLEFSTKTSKLKQVDSNLLITLMQASQVVAAAPQSFDIKVHDVVNSVLDYICRWNTPIESLLLEYFYSWYQEQAVECNKAFITPERKCNLCSHDFYTENVKLNTFISDYLSQIENKLMKNGMNKDMVYLKKLFYHGNSFDAILDGGNIIYQGSKSEKIFSLHRLKNTLNDLCSNENKFLKIALVLPQSYYRASKMKSLAFLKQLAQEKIYDLSLNIIVCRMVHDDQVFLYMSALNEKVRNDFQMVSNDQFFDHLQVLDKKLQQDWLKWRVQRSVKIDIDGTCLSDPMFLPKYESASRIHLVGDNNQVICIKNR